MIQMAARKHNATSNSIPSFLDDLSRASVRDLHSLIRSPRRRGRAAWNLASRLKALRSLLVGVELGMSVLSFPALHAAALICRGANVAPVVAARRWRQDRHSVAAFLIGAW